MDTREIPANKAVYTAAPQQVPRGLCALAIPKTFLTQEEISLAHTGICGLLLAKNREEAQDLCNFFLTALIQCK